MVHHQAISWKWIAQIDFFVSYLPFSTKEIIKISTDELRITSCKFSCIPQANRKTKQKKKNSLKLKIMYATNSSSVNVYGQKNIHQPLAESKFVKLFCAKYGRSAHIHKVLHADGSYLHVRICWTNIDQNLLFCPQNKI